MSWINQHQNDWRIALIVVMVVAFMGPWTFDRISVPAKYACSPPYIRLDGDFCGMPYAGVRMFFGNGGNIILISLSLLSGESLFSERILELLFCCLLLFPLLPFFSTLHLILRPDHRCGQTRTIAAWILATGGALFVGLNFWKAWGAWLYIGLGAIALVLESITIYKNRKIIVTSNGAEDVMD